MRRRTFVLGAGASAAAGVAPSRAVGAITPPSGGEPFAAEERRGNGRLGVCAIALRDGRRIERRAGERFPLASTFKLPLVMLVLQRIDHGVERLDRTLRFTGAEIVGYSPAFEGMKRGGTISVGALCAAAIEHSDNTAANMLLRTVGGPPAVTSYLRRLGDRVTRLDRNEPALNEATRGDVRDTTSPAAMAELLVRLLREPVLSAASKARLFGWMRACDTGLARIRAGVPHRWTVADKTGTTNSGGNDVAILWPPHGAPIVLAVYFAEVHASDAERDAAIASVARNVTRAFAQ
ncbi:MAG TPA: class A beta-lactamase [Candidatus Elarobacter sp.]|jgi:beta-lactamase class A|nr:class A beta-lactamase [Candidatus Elarobacter sp.]